MIQGVTFTHFTLNSKLKTLTRHFSKTSCAEEQILLPSLWTHQCVLNCQKPLPLPSVSFTQVAWFRRPTYPPSVKNTKDKIVLSTNAFLCNGLISNNPKVLEDTSGYPTSCSKIVNCLSNPRKWNKATLNWIYHDLPIIPSWKMILHHPSPTYQPAKASYISGTPFASSIQISRSWSQGPLRWHHSCHVMLHVKTRLLDRWKSCITDGEKIRFHHDSWQLQNQHLRKVPREGTFGGANPNVLS